MRLVCRLSAKLDYLSPPHFPLVGESPSVRPLKNSDPEQHERAAHRGRLGDLWTFIRDVRSLQENVSTWIRLLATFLSTYCLIFPLVLLPLSYLSCTVCTEYIPAPLASRRRSEHLAGRSTPGEEDIYSPSPHHSFLLLYISHLRGPRRGVRREEAISFNRDIEKYFFSKPSPSRLVLNKNETWTLMYPQGGGF